MSNFDIEFLSEEDARELTTEDLQKARADADHMLGRVGGHQRAKRLENTVRVADAELARRNS